EERKNLTGNFRSSPNICKTIAQFRPPSVRGLPDEPLGLHKDETTPVHILSYSGTAVPSSIGANFCTLLDQSGIDVSHSPVIAATKASGAAAVGQPRPTGRRDRSVRLAEAVTGFHFAAGFNDMKTAIDCAHQILLDLEGRLDNISYHQYLADNEIEPVTWRSKVIFILQELRFDTEKYADARAWHAAAKELLEKHITIERNGQSISQKLRWNAKIETALVAVSSATAMSRTIHSVKGMEYPAVCLVTTASTRGNILEFLETGEPADKAEDARKLYVAASRAKRLLVIAAPRSQTERLGAHLRGHDATVTIEEV
ncbi:MAG: ATP-dependent helicase, partial [Gammaproteobacteria bacterium]|nr:ATP-dependent helicase [Gammaproteobacteria bacterium]